MNRKLTTPKAGFSLLVSITITLLLIEMLIMRKSAQIAQNLTNVEARCSRTSSGKEMTRLIAVVKAFGSVCHDLKCHAALQSATEQAVDRVPRIRHILWKSERVSVYFAQQLKSWIQIHPNWTYVLWRDKDLEGFVARQYPGLLYKFRTLKHHIMRVDMIRYLILYRFGGVYADLDYTLVRPLDRFLKYPATVPITAEAIAMMYFGMKWPPDRLANPALMISEPQHPFFYFCILQLAANPSQEIFQFAGPLGLSAMVNRFAIDFQILAEPTGIIFVPPSRAFDAFANNSFRSSTTIHKNNWIAILSRMCLQIKKSNSSAERLQKYCNDVYNMDPITNKNDVSYAVHDTKKLRTSYDPLGSPQFANHLVDITTVDPRIITADQFILSIKRNDFFSQRFCKH